MKKWYRIDRDNFLVPRVHILFVWCRAVSLLLLCPSFLLNLEIMRPLTTVRFRLLSFGLCLALISRTAPRVRLEPLKSARSTQSAERLKSTDRGTMMMKRLLLAACLVGMASGFSVLEGLKMPSLQGMVKAVENKEKFGDKKLVVITGTSSGVRPLRLRPTPSVRCLDSALLAALHPRRGLLCAER